MQWHRWIPVAACVSLLVTLTLAGPPAAQARLDRAGMTREAATRSVTEIDRRAAVTLSPTLQRVLAKVNAVRKRHDRKPLRATSCLTRKVAQPWARHMADTETMVHRDLSEVFRLCTGLSTVGENIAAGYSTAASVMKAWLHSPGHRKNILRARFTMIGLGVARSADGTRYWVQDFGG